MANKRFNQITRDVTSFDSNDVLPIGNGTLGDGKMSGFQLLELTAQNALADNVAPAFDPTRDEDHKYLAGEDVMYNGTLYRFKADHYGAWVAADAFAIAVDTIAKSSVSIDKISNNYKKDIAFTGNLTPVNFLNPNAPDANVKHYMLLTAGGSVHWTKLGTSDVDFFGGNYGASGYIPVIPGETLYVYDPTGNVAYGILCFDEKKEYKGRHYDGVNSFVVPKDTYYIRTLTATKAYADSGVNYSVYRVPVSPFVYYPYIETEEEKFYLKEQDFSKIVGCGENLFSPDDPDVEDGKFLNVDGTWSVDSRFSETGFIPIIPGKPLFYYMRGVVPPNKLPFVTYCFYDKDKNYVSGGTFGNTNCTQLSVIPDSSVRYIRIPLFTSRKNDLCLGYSPFSKYVPYGQREVVLMSDVVTELGQSNKPISQKTVTDALSNFDPTGLGAHWTGKKWYAYGTSITDTTPTGKYLPYLATMSGMIATDKGIGGGGIGDLGAYSRGQVFNAICNTTDGKTEADLITLETGANDTNASVPLGTIYDTTQDTLAGCLNICLRYLQANTTAQIAVMPSVATTILPNEADQYFKWQLMIRDICTINRVFFIEPACNLGYGKLTGPDGTLYRDDSIHQTDLGGYVLAEAMWEQIKRIPNFRTALPTP